VVSTPFFTILTFFFDGIIDDPLVATSFVSGVNVVATYVALLIMDRTGRKTLILWSSAGMFLSCVVVVVALLGLINNRFAILAVITFVSFFEIGLGPVPWLIVAEMFDGKYVAMAMSISSQLNWVCNSIISMVFPYMNTYMGPYSFIPFAVVLACTFMFTLFVLPETQGKTPDDLAAEMSRTNSQSMVYEINEEEAGAINLEWKKAMDQLKEEEQTQMKDGTFDYGFKPIN